MVGPRLFEPSAGTFWSTLTNVHPRFLHTRWELCFTQNSFMHCNSRLASEFNWFKYLMMIFLCTIKSTYLNNFVIKPFCISWVFCCHPAVLIVNHESFPSKRAVRHRSNACIQDSVSIIVSKFASTDVRPPGNVGVFYSSDSAKFGESSRILKSFDSRIACQISEILAELLDSPRI
jgi:hypothetical protein